GLRGPWRAPNFSVAFDAYALSWGPANGPLCLMDFCATQLMRSNVNTANLEQLAHWMRQKENDQALQTLREKLMQCSGLAKSPAETINLMANIADRMIEDKDSLAGVSIAKVWKGLSAWLPAHAPMYDSNVHTALTGYPTPGPNAWLHRSTILLQRFSELLIG